MKKQSYLTYTEAQAFDKHLINMSMSIESLIEKAGFLIKEWLVSYLSNREFVGIIGKGNNGRDILSAFNQLPKDYKCKLFFCNANDDMLSTYERLLDNKNISCVSNLDIINSDSIIIDGIFGTGLNRKLEVNTIEIIKQINSMPNQTVSVDIPSGLHEFNDSMSVIADVTLSMMFPKKVFLDPIKKKICGKIFVLNFSLLKSQTGPYELPDIDDYFYLLS